MKNFVFFALFVLALSALGCVSTMPAGNARTVNIDAVPAAVSPATMRTAFSYPDDFERCSEMTEVLLGPTGFMAKSTWTLDLEGERFLQDMLVLLPDTETRGKIHLFGTHVGRVLGRLVLNDFNQATKDLVESFIDQIRESSKKTGEASPGFRQAERNVLVSGPIFVFLQTDRQGLRGRTVLGWNWSALSSASNQDRSERVLQKLARFEDDPPTRANELLSLSRFNRHRMSISGLGEGGLLRKLFVPTYRGIVTFEAKGVELFVDFLPEELQRLCFKIK